MKAKNRFLIALLVIVVAHLGFGQRNDFWLKIERKGTGFGYEHTTVSRLGNGNLEYCVEQHTKTDLVGINPQDITSKASYVVTVDLKPISLDFHFQSLTKKQRITGSLERDTLRLAIVDETGSMSKKEIPFEGVYFDAVLADLTLKNEKEKKFNMKVFDPLNLSVREIEVEILTSNAEEVEAKVSGRFPLKYRIDRKGRVKEVEYTGANIRAYLTSAEDAKNIAYLNTADGFTLTVKSTKSFPNVFRVSKARVQVKWKHIPFDQFNFVDNRQRVVDKKSSNDECEVTLELTKPTDVAEGATTQKTDQEYAAYLQDDEFIKPSDSSIRTQLSEIRGNDKNPTVVVQNILRWVSENVKADLIAETLTGPEVLQKKRGKCSEFSILFASLARSARIPTRIVLGELYSGNQWIGHMWNEVWLGRWVAVDAGIGAFVSGPAHIKFVDSPTVIGTQDIRWKLVDNLSIEILNYEEEPQRSATELKPGIAGRTYFNKNFSCKISAPDETWVIQEREQAGHTVLEMNAKDGSRFALVLFAVPPNMAAKTILDGRLNAIARMAKDFEKLEEGEIQIAQRKVPRVLFKQSGRDQTTLFNENGLLIDGANAYLFAFISPEAQFANVKQSYLKIIGSFEIVR